MDRVSSFTQVASVVARVHGQQLGDDADGDLFGAFGAYVEADRAEDTALARRPDESKNLLRARARPEQPDVRRVGLQKQPQPVAIVFEGVHLHDDEGARVYV
jgi:hypothetical protein